MSKWDRDNDVEREALWHGQAEAMIAAAYPAQGRASSPDWRLGFREGWGLSREVLLSDEAVERVADALEALDGDDYLTVARAALIAAIGEEEG